MIEIPGLEEGEFTVLGVLGKGGMGTVYRAMQHSLKREVAIKVLDQQGTASPDARERFVQEISLMGQLSHPNLAKLYLGDVSGDTPWFAMELLTGEPLDARIDREAPLPVPACLKILDEMARGLEYLHAADIVHRDVKPSNVFLTRNSGVKLLDFGLARLLESGGLTQPGAVIGTLDYMAPELLLDGAPSAQSDLWALGAVAYGMVTGRHHLSATSARGRITHEDRLAPSIVPPARVNGFLPKEVSQLVMWLLEADPGRRPASAGAFLEELQVVKELVTGGGSLSLDSVWLRTELAGGDEPPVILVTPPARGARQRNAAILGLAAGALLVAVAVLSSRPAAGPVAPSAAMPVQPAFDLRARIPAGHEEIGRYAHHLEAWLSGVDPGPAPRPPGAPAGPASAMEVELQTERLRLAGEEPGPQALVLALEMIAGQPDEASGWLVLSELLLAWQRPGEARRALEHGLTLAVPEPLARADRRTWRALARGPARQPDRERIERWWTLARGSKGLRAPIQGLADVLFPHQVELYRKILFHPLEAGALDEELVESLVRALAGHDWATGRLLLDRALEKTRSPALTRTRTISMLLRGEITRLKEPAIDAGLTPGLRRILPYLEAGPASWKDAGPEGEEHPRVRDFYLLEAGRVEEAESLLVEMHSVAARDPGPGLEPGGRHEDLGCLALELIARGDTKAAWLRLWRGHLPRATLDRHWSSAAGALSTGPATARFAETLAGATELQDRHLEPAIRALAHSRAGRHTPALDALEEMRRSPPEEIPVAFVHEILARVRLGRDGKVIPVTVDPRQRAMLGELAPLDEALARGDLPAALPLARKLADDRPENPFHRFLVCWILSAQRSPELEPARSAARAAIRWQARDAWALRELDALGPAQESR